MRVPDDVDAEATVEVLVLGAVHVPDARAFASLEVDRVGIAHLEVRGPPARQALGRPLVQLLRSGCRAEELPGFFLGDLRRTRLEPLKVHDYHLLRPPNVPEWPRWEAIRAALSGSS